MRWQWTIDTDGQPVDVVLDADPETPIELIAEALELPLATIAPGAGADAAAAEHAPHSGTVLPLRNYRPEPAAVAVRFRSGPLSGQIVPLSGDRLSIGRAEDNDLQLTDPSVSRHHLLLTPDGDGVRVAPVEGAGPVRVNGELVDVEGIVVGGDDLIEAGASVLSVGGFVTAPADLWRDGSGDLAFNRPSRIRPATVGNRVALPGPRPEPQENTPLPWAMAAGPILLGGVMVAVTKQPTMLLMSVMSPVMVFANFRQQRSSSKKRGKNELGKWRDAVERSTQQLSDITEAERRSAWRTFPDPATVREICRRQDNRLWERRRTDPDALALRLGVAELPVPVKLDGQFANPDTLPPVMSPVPVAVDLGSARVLGIAGRSADAQALGRWTLLQLATLRSPLDLRLVVLCDKSAARAWEWLRWLPHARVDAANAPVAMIGNTEETRLARVRELVKEVEARQAVLADDREAEFEEQIVVLLDGARQYRTITGMATVLREGPDVGVFAICLDTDRSRLPEEVRAELLLDQQDPTLALLEVAGQQSLSRLLLDTVSPEVAEECARTMTPIRHVGGDGDQNVLPTSVRFVDQLGIDLDDPEWVASRWTLSGRSTRALVGAGADGDFTLDLKADGPHGLVAGTTGAGKSEFLQTLVISLAINNRPDSLNFVLVDYKGASAFADCERLPHTVGMVTNLDNRETERALESLDAELKRRELVLKQLGAKDVDDAWDRDADFSARNGLARLVIVIDEFAELVHELPDFVTGLIRIARVGRSLGVHLILATQRPAGVVSAEMQANVGLRVGLRMVDKADSTEVLGSPESAFISPSTPGRGYVRRGPGTAPSGFQTARVAGRRPGAHALSSRKPVLKPVPWLQLGEPLSLTRASAGSDDPAATDLHALVEVVGQAAHRLDIPVNPSPWLPALPELITLSELARRHPNADGALLGLRDVPSEQAQTPLVYRIEDGEHLLIAGSARSGRSSVLRTLIAELCSRHSPDDLHLYAIDFGNGALLPARDLPHCGAVVTATESARFVRLLGRLTDELTRRQLILSTDGFGDVNEQRAAAGPAQALPYILLTLDRWEGVLSAFSVEQLQQVRDRVVTILREGPAVGVRVVIAGDQALLTDRIVNFIETRYLLRLADRDDYRLANIRPNTLPETIPAGRAYYGDPVNEAQFAVISSDVSGQAQAAALRQLVAEIKQKYEGADRIRPFRLDVMPTVIPLSRALELPVATPTEGIDILIGVGGDTLSQYRMDFTGGPGFLVAGQRRSGRSTYLATAAQVLHAQGVPLLAVAPKPSPLAEAATALGVPVLTELAQAGPVTDWAAEQQQCAVLVDDAEVVHGSEVDSALIELARERAPGTFALLVAAGIDELNTLLRGVAVEAKRQKQGVLLWPGSSLDGNALGAGVARDLLGRSQPGRALLLREDEWFPVQMPLPDQVQR
ncbi:MAG TPA: FtsK/SpoIIIE domain-containing protein [Jatrophihabitans sp.]|nr:FtsK/SpoIIIE domain-containing protein [Jatrophihabitans sp.]